MELDESGIIEPIHYEANLICIEEKAEGDDFDISHWEVSTLNSVRNFNELEEIIEDASFKTFGCGAAIATSSMATELIKGKSIKEALNDDKEIRLANDIVFEEMLTIPADKNVVIDLNGKTINSNGEMKDIPPTWYTRLCEKCEKEPDKIHILFFKTVKAAFAQRRKTLKNCLLGGGFDREKIVSALEKTGRAMPLF